MQGADRPTLPVQIAEPDLDLLQLSAVLVRAERLDDRFPIGAEPMQQLGARFRPGVGRFHHEPRQDRVFLHERERRLRLLKTPQKSLKSGRRIVPGQVPFQVGHSHLKDNCPADPPVNAGGDVLCDLVGHRVRIKWHLRIGEC